MTNTSYEDDIFDIDITSADPDEPLWDKLTQNIIEGKVIPVIGPELLMVNNVNINKFIIDGLGRKLGIPNPPRSYSEIVYSPEYKAVFGKRDVDRDRIYNVVYKVLAKTKFPATPQLERFLSIRQFPFVITTSFAPIVEQAMSD